MTDVVNVGTSANSGTGDTLRAAFQAINTKFDLLDAQAAYNASLYTNRGNWLTATVYALNDLAVQSSIVYVATTPHTSGTFATDLAAGKWAVHQGITAAELMDDTGAGLVGFDAGAGYSNGTVGSRLAGVFATDSYATFADAITAADNATLRINSAIVVAANTSIPATVDVEVVRPGAISVNSGVTLTINGAFKAGQRQIFSGSGSVVFGNGSRAISPRIWFGTSGAVYDTRRTVLQTDGDTTGPVHAYEDNNTLAMTHTSAANYNAYASFDANPAITGAGAYDHHVSFQARPTYSGSNSIWSRWDGFNFLGTHSGSGTVAAMRGVHIQDPLGSGVITALYGIFVQKLTRGAESWGIYCATPANTISVGGGEAASWLLRGNGQTGGYGLSLQSRTDSSAHVLQVANSWLGFGTNNAYQGYITAAGLWKISTSIADVLSSNQKLEVEGTGAATFKATGGATVGAVLNWHAATTGNNLFEAFYTEGTATLRGSIDFNRGSLVTRYNTTSDAALKTVLGDAPPEASTAILASTRMREYTWKADPTQKPQIGVIAQELHQTFPGAVSVGDKKRPWAVDKTAFTFHLIAGWQQHQREIAELRAEIDALKRRG
jgi:hypothetical protein